ncbi:MAG: thioredoxin domain-containing protein [Candidatus Paceibacterota bacterium]|jgi:protein-disulfide isomerase
MKTQQYLIPASIVVAGLLVAVGIFFGGKGTGPNVINPQAANQQPQAQKVDIKNVNTKDEPFIGNPNAKVTIAYWSDYQCPFCKQFETTTFQDVVKNYVTTNKVKIVFKDFQFLGPDSGTAALFARSIWNLYPDKYFVWREALTNKQDAENGGFGDQASIVAMTKTISGIDANKVVADIDTNKDNYKKAIDADRAEGAKFGINGTPGFILGNQTLSGAVGYPQFSQALDAELK